MPTSENEYCAQWGYAKYEYSFVQIQGSEKYEMMILWLLSTRRNHNYTIQAQKKNQTLKPSVTLDNKLCVSSSGQQSRYNICESFKMHYQYKKSICHKASSPTTNASPNYSDKIYFFNETFKIGQSLSIMFLTAVTYAWSSRAGVLLLLSW